MSDSHRTRPWASASVVNTTPLKAKQQSLPQNGDIPAVIKTPRHSDEVVDYFTGASAVTESGVLNHAVTDSVEEASRKRKRSSVHGICPVPVKVRRRGSESVAQAARVSCRAPQQPSQGKRKASASAVTTTQSSKQKQRTRQEEGTSASPLLSESAPLPSSRSTNRRRTCQEESTSPAPAPQSLSRKRQKTSREETTTLPSSRLKKRQRMCRDDSTSHGAGPSVWATVPSSPLSTGQRAHTQDSHSGSLRLTDVGGNNVPEGASRETGHDELPSFSNPTKTSEKHTAIQRKQYTKEEKRVRQRLKQNGVPVLQERRLREMKSYHCETLGYGSYGSCCLVKDPKTCKHFVVKTFHENELKCLVEEALVLKQNQAPGVQRLIGACIHTRELVTAYAGTTIDEYFMASSSFPDAVRVLLQAAQTIQRISEAGFTHNDIKEDNVCVDISSDRKEPVVTVIDLGLAARAGTWNVYDGTTSHDPQDLPWMAPELLHNTHPCSEASDVYGLALLIEYLFMLLEGRAPVTSLGPLMEWVRAARSHDPQQRPALGALIEVLQVLLQNARCQGASSGQSPSSGDDKSETLNTSENTLDSTD